MVWRVCAWRDCDTLGEVCDIGEVRQTLNHHQYYGFEASDCIECVLSMRVDRLRDYS